MAWLYQDPLSENFKVCFRFRGRPYKKSLKTKDRDDAEIILGGVERTLLRLEQNLLELPPGAEVLTFVLDVTSERHAEEQARIAENRYRTLVAAANEGVWLVDSTGRTTFANAKVGRILGRPLQEIAQTALLDYVDDRDRAAVAGALECPRDTPEAFEARFRDASGGEVLCLMSVSAVSGEGLCAGEPQSAGPAGDDHAVPGHARCRGNVRGHGDSLTAGEATPRPVSRWRVRKPA